MRECSYQHWSGHLWLTVDFCSKSTSESITYLLVSVKEFIIINNQVINYSLINNYVGILINHLKRIFLHLLLICHVHFNLFLNLDFLLFITSVFYKQFLTSFVWQQVGILITILPENLLNCQSGVFAQCLQLLNL